jgi:PAS domain S-box-containing protein
MHDVLAEVLEVFDCDRAFLMHPCDPTAKSWTVPMECTRPEYPGLGILNEEIPMDEHVAGTMEMLLNTPGAVKFGPETDYQLSGAVDERFEIKSMMSIVLQPKVGKPWQFGLHQCSHGRIWTEAEKQMLEEVAPRLADALTSLLVLRDMRESERRLVEAQRLAHIGNWELDLINDTLTWSDEIYRIFQIDKKEFGASYEAFLEAIHPDDREAVNMAYSESIKSRHPYDIVHRLLLPGGRIKYVREMCETLYDPVGKPVRSLGTVQDITEQKHREQELSRYRDHLEEEVHQRTDQLRLARNAAEAANQAKSAFLANMSHELRTPLNAILGFSHMMQQDATLSDAQHQTLDIINNSGEHLLKLINDVLEIAKIEAGKLQLEKATYDLHLLVREVSDMMRLRAVEKGLQLKLDQASEFPRFVKGDEARMRQIMVNLVSNAVKFTEEGIVTIRLRGKKNAQRHLVIEVEDTGPGISKKDQQRLFQPFVQLPDGKSQIGTGLGLSIVQQFVKLMGGEIAVESTPGKGSLFRVELPLESADETEITRLSGESRGEVTGVASGQPVFKILIAEDQRDNQLLLTKLMTDIGLEVKVANDGEECVELFKKWKPDLIWMDRRMPVMDGVEATRSIRHTRGGKIVKIIAVTASAFREQEEELRNAGMDDYVSKPYRFNEIYDCLTRQLGLQFIYSEEQRIKGGAGATLTPEMLSGIGEELQIALRQSLETLDSERIGEVVSQIAEKDRALAQTLKGLTDNYDYPTILQVLDESMS